MLVGLTLLGYAANFITGAMGAKLARGPWPSPVVSGKGKDCCKSWDRRR